MPKLGYITVVSFMGLLCIDWVMPGPVVRDPRASSEEQLVAPPWLAPRWVYKGGHLSFLFPQKMAATRPHRFVLDCLLSISRENDRNQTSSVCARLSPFFFFLGVLVTSDLIVVNASSPVLCVELCLNPSTSMRCLSPKLVYLQGLC